MSSNLPPGVTDADIERQAASDSLLERFEQYLNKQDGGKSFDDETVLSYIYGNRMDMPPALQGSLLQEFVERAMQWAYEEGANDYGWQEP